jgi:hypothetical protein
MKKLLAVKPEGENSAGRYGHIMGRYIESGLTDVGK